MTKQQILAEIAAKIDGQGSAIDAGSALPGILRGILDLIPEGIKIKRINLASWDFQAISNVSKSEFATALGCLEAEVDEIFADNVGQLKLSIDSGNGNILLKVAGGYNGNWAVFGTALGDIIAKGVYFSKNHDDYSATWFEV